MIAPVPTLSGGSTYNVHRGMSPTTANRIQNRVQELEEALEQERVNSLRSDRQIADFNLQLVSAQEKIDEADHEIQAQIDANRRGEMDYLKLKKEYEILLANNDLNDGNTKRKFTEIIKDLEDQLDKVRHQKSKLEKEKQTFVIEIDNLNNTLDSASKNNDFSSHKMQDLDDQLRRLNNKCNDLGKQNSELMSVKNKLENENTLLLKNVQDYETKFGLISSNKTHIQTQLTDLRSKYDDEMRGRNQTGDQLYQLQAEYDKLHAAYDEELEAADGLRGQLSRVQAEYLAFKTKFEKDFAGRDGELEELRRKYNAKISELEGEIENLRSKNNRLEKDKTKLNIECKDLGLQIDDANALLGENMRRQKHLEHLVTELQKKADEMGSELVKANSDLESAQAEILRLKTLNGDLQEKVDHLNRELAKMMDSHKDQEHTIKDQTRTITELTMHRNDLSTEKDDLLHQLHDIRDEYQSMLSKMDSAGGSANQVRIDLESKLRDREVEVEAMRHKSQTSISEMQITIVDLENRLKGESSKLKKKFGAEIQEYQIQLDVLSRANMDLEKGKKHGLSKIRDLEGALDFERKAAREANDNASNLEKRLVSLLSELDDLKLLYDTSEKARRKMEVDHADSSQSITDIHINIANLQNDRKRLEADLNSYEHRLSDSDSSRRMAEEKADRLASELARVNDQLKIEQQNVTTHLANSKQLEVQLRDVVIRLEESEMSKDGRKVISQYKNRVAELERDLESEARRGKDALNEAMKFKRQLSDLKMQSDRDHALVIEYSDAINQWQAKFGALKSQLEQNEEVLNITMGKYRKVQAELDDAQRRADRAEAQHAAHVRHNTTVIGAGAGASFMGASNHGLLGGRARAMSVQRDYSGRFIR